MRISLYIACLSVVVSGFITCGAAPASSGTASAYLTRRGTELLLDGKPFRAVGVNKFDLALQFLRGGEERIKAEKDIKDVAAHGLRVIRFAAVGFYPKDMELWSRDEYWKAMDDLVAAARASNVLLIPCLNWNWYLFPDMTGETVQDMLTDRDSKSRQYVELYTYQMVTRYKNEPQLLFWEIGNELNLCADLAFMRPYGYSELNWIQLGTAHVRVRRDNFTTGQMIRYLKDMARLIRKHDPNHLISSGHSTPRQSAQHLRRKSGDWTFDSPQEAENYIRDVHPDPIDLISLHFYKGEACPRFDNNDPKSASALRTLKQICDRVGKPAYIGETGDVYDDKSERTLAFTQDVLREAEAQGYPLVIYWMSTDVKDPLAFDLEKRCGAVELLVATDKKMRD